MPTKRAWRKLIKKQQRKRRRQKTARDRDKEDELELRQKESDPEYQEWLRQQEELEEFKQLAEERRKQNEEEDWLRREALAQRQFQLDTAKLRKQEAEAERIREQQAKELQVLLQEQRRWREEKQKQAEKAAAEFEEWMQRLHDYMEDDGNHTPPAELRRVVDSHPEERLCEFYTRTNFCRFGHACTFNHRRPMLAKILLIRHFFSHPLLQAEDTSTEYANADEHLELTEKDLRADYDEFFMDVVEELEKFGKIVNFRAVRNILPYLRGHVFVEYAQERFALRAFINLQGRYYASKRLNVEFSNISAWRGAICGLSLTRKCPKGYSCGYLHLFNNPNNLFHGNLGSYKKPRPAISPPKTVRSQTNSWNDIGKESRNWRWSESPELELNVSKTRSSSPDHKRDGRSLRSRQDVDQRRSSTDYRRNSRTSPRRNSSGSSQERTYSRSRSPARYRHERHRRRIN